MADLVLVIGADALLLHASAAWSDVLGADPMRAQLNQQAALGGTET